MSPKLKKISPKNPEISKDKKQDYIVFSFSNLKRISYCDVKKDPSFFIQFLDRLQKISTQTWGQVYNTNKHGIGGTEPMAVKNLEKSAQNLVPAGINTLQVMRATGDNKVFLGTRDGNVFNIMFIECNFGEIYSHK